MVDTKIARTVDPNSAEVAAHNLFPHALVGHTAVLLCLSSFAEWKKMGP